MSLTRNDLAPLLRVGDPLADAALAEAVTAGAEGNKRLDQAIRFGLSRDTPPALTALLRDAEAAVDRDQARLRRGSDAFLAIGAPWIGFALGPGSLTHTYSSPSIAKVLMRTGNLARAARRRIEETGQWNVATVSPGGLERGEDGYVQNLQVRLLHARVRRALLEGGWDAARDHAPINQLELARTWLDFTYVPFRSLTSLGISFSDDEIADLYYLWQVAAHLLGVDERLYGPVTDQPTAEALMTAIDSFDGPPSEDSRALTQAMVEAMGGLLAKQLRLPTPVARALVAAVLRRLHGHELAGRLGVGPTWASLLLPPIVAANRWRRWRERRDPRRRAAAIAATARAFEGAGAMETAYGRAAANADAELFSRAG